MDNTLYKFIGDRSISILDHIDRYCLAENKEKLSVLRITTAFLDSLKERLDEAFISTCIGYLGHKTDKATQKALSLITPESMKQMLLNEELSAYFIDEILMIDKKNEANRHLLGAMKFYLNPDRSDFEKLKEQKNRLSNYSSFLYAFEIETLYFSEDAGLEIKYTDHTGKIVTTKYSRLSYIPDYDLVSTTYDQVIKESGIKCSSNADNKVIDAKMLEQYFKPQFKGMGGGINKFATFMQDLQGERTAKDFAKIAWLAYEGKFMNDRRPGSFSKWLSIFFKAIGIQGKYGYKPCELEDIDDSTKKIFSYLL